MQWKTMRWSPGPFLALALVAAPVAGALAAPIDDRDVAGLDLTASFAFDAPGGTLTRGTSLNFGNGSVFGSGGFATVVPASLNISPVSMNGLSGAFARVRFDPFLAGHPVFPNVDVGGEFTFAATDAVLRSFEPGSPENGNVTSFEAIVLGDVQAIHDSVPTEAFDPAEFSLLVNGQSADGTGTGSFSGSLTVPPSVDLTEVAFLQAEELPEPGALGFLFTAATLTVAAARRRRQNDEASA